jgi:hypothetical protein
MGLGCDPHHKALIVGAVSIGPIKGRFRTVWDRYWAVRMGQGWGSPHSVPAMSGPLLGWDGGGPILDHNWLDISNKMYNMLDQLDCPDGVV